MELLESVSYLKNLEVWLLCGSDQSRRVSRSENPLRVWSLSQQSHQRGNRAASPGKKRELAQSSTQHILLLSEKLLIGSRRQKSEDCGDSRCLSEGPAHHFLLLFFSSSPPYISIASWAHLQRVKPISNYVSAQFKKVAALCFYGLWGVVTMSTYFSTFLTYASFYNQQKVIEHFNERYQAEDPNP